MNCEVVAVIMSVYGRDKLSYLKLSCDSILNSDYPNITFYIAVDGPVCDEVAEYLQRLNVENINVEVIFGVVNKGLAFRLNELIDLALKDPLVNYIARMDADDISYSNRISLQVDFLKKNQLVGVVGTSLREIDENGIPTFVKTMPENHDVLEKHIIRKCPFNHPTVMFRKCIFSKFKTRYNPSLRNTQDYYLWVDLLSRGIRFANLKDPLLDFRIDSKFYARRGFSKAKNDFFARLYAMNVLKCKTIENYFFSIALFFFRISPLWIKVLAYKHFR